MMTTTPAATVSPQGFSGPFPVPTARGRAKSPARGGGPVKAVACIYPAPELDSRGRLVFGARRFQHVIAAAEADVVGVRDRPVGVIVLQEEFPAADVADQDVLAFHDGAAGIPADGQPSRGGSAQAEVDGVALDRP